jgi:hypothetical protein
MGNIRKKLNGIANEIRIKAINKQRVCYFQNCQELAIDSHILQRNGILNKISENGHVYALDYSIISDNGTVKFERVGLAKAMTFKGFCKKHDNDIFLEIENKDNINFNLYRVQLLFIYRNLLCELRKKEINIDFFEALLKEKIYRNYIGYEGIDYFNTMIKGTKAGINDNLYYHNALIKDLEDDNSKSYNFVVVEIPFLEVCLSATVAYEDLETSFYFYNSFPELINKPIDNLFINLFPYDKKSILMIGYHRNSFSCQKYVEQFSKLSVEHIIKKISNFMLLNAEMWTCSPNFYQTKILPKEKFIKKILNDYSNQFGVENDLDINLFE